MIDDDIENGRKLFRSAENLRRSSLDLDALMESLHEIVMEETFADGAIEKVKGEDESSGTDWVTHIYTDNYKIRRTGRGRALLGTITFVVRLCGEEEPVDGPDWPWLDQACLLVCWHKDVDDHWYAGNFEPSEEAHIRDHRNGLWSWQHDGEDWSYFFALPIFSLRNEADLRRLVVKPFKILFESDDIPGAIAAAFMNVPVLMAKPA